MCVEDTLDRFTIAHHPLRHPSTRYALISHPPPDPLLPELHPPNPHSQPPNLRTTLLHPLLGPLKLEIPFLTLPIRTQIPLHQPQRPHPPLLNHTSPCSKSLALTSRNHSKSTRPRRRIPNMSVTPVFPA
ncbi:hypothetical protein COCSADRAFT_174390 [Bipolaris sorokiniana ND90Pr]|uniref:Uncharacterized protein n=1 Tax=Cochliobolus sativus (strain ND90Pr / ATCC 201652) TaxID=665912 RepID=M2SF68_COCSN|nr:uncharacterized protein COCSADRAFT_174390 [Bipolaris sorokiniana ND90Pr]EMD61070.1 hypothetical protein COCSADRAFT_174390 [Bipolaris sorokiniana ND90Pr]